jgi:hypothetical protein
MTVAEMCLPCQLLFLGGRRERGSYGGRDKSGPYGGRRERGPYVQKL